MLKKLKFETFSLQTNATRGVIAAFVVVAIFLGYALLDRFPNIPINFPFFQDPVLSIHVPFS